MNRTQESVLPPVEGADLSHIAAGFASSPLPGPANAESSISRFGVIRKQLLERKIVIVAMFFVVVFLLVGLLGPYFVGDPNAQNYSAILKPPSAEHLLGTDHLGRDVFARAVEGARVSLIAALGTTALALGVGVPLGLVAGYYRGFLDSLLMRTTDVVLAFPFLVFAVGLSAISGPSLLNVIIALGIALSPTVVRITRGEVMALRELDYVSGAIADGARDGRILFRYILPNVLDPLIVQATLFIPIAIIAEAGLSYLGLGVPPPGASWGTMLTTAQPHLHNAVWLSLVPGLFIMVTTVSFNLVGDGIRDVLDPRSN